MAMEKSRVAVIMAALLGQSYSLLSGQAKHTYTGEGFHGWLCTCARRAGFLNFVEMIPPDFKDVERLDKTALEKVWREWAHLETFKRWDAPL